MAWNKPRMEDKAYKYEADLKNVLQDFAMKFIHEQPDDIPDFGISYFQDLKSRGIVINEESTEFEPNDEQEVSSLATGGRRKTVFSDPFDPESEPDPDFEFYPKPPQERQSLVQKAKEVMLFKSLDEEEFEQVLDAIYEMKVQEGDKVIQQGDNGDFFYIIDFGIFEASISNEDGDKVIKTYHHYGSFGELALMYDVPRSATITAKTEGRLWVMKRDSFRRIVLTSAFKKRKIYEELLEKVPILSILNHYEKSNVADALIPKSYKAEEMIIKQGEVADGMFFVESGEVDVTVKDAEGSEVVVNSLEKGDYFGEVALVTQQLRAASAKAKTPVKVAYLDVDAFERLMGPCMDLIKRNLALYEEQKKLIMNYNSPPENKK